MKCKTTHHCPSISTSVPEYTPTRRLFLSLHSRVLRRLPNLNQSSYTQVRAWSRRVGGCTRISRSVRSLILPETLSWSYSTSSQEIYEFRKSLSVALRATINFVPLTIRASLTSCLLYMYLDLWILEGCKFRLRNSTTKGTRFISRGGL